MIIKNEEFFLRDCLAAVCDLVDEIIIVDTGSTDGSKAIAGDFTNKIIDYTWNDDFSAARNVSLESATSDWILVLDADETITPADLESLRSTIADTACEAYYLPRYNYSNNHLEPGWRAVDVDSTLSRDCTGYTVHSLVRLFRSRPDIRYSKPVHESVIDSLAGANVGELGVTIHHWQDGDQSKGRDVREMNYARIAEKHFPARQDGELAETIALGHLNFSGDYGKAAEYYRLAIEQGHNVDKSREGLAEALYRGGDHVQARELYTALIDSGYRSFSAFLNLGNLMVKAKEFSGAVEMLEGALELAGHNQQMADVIRKNIRFLQSKS